MPPTGWNGLVCFGYLSEHGPHSQKCREEGEDQVNNRTYITKAKGARKNTTQPQTSIFITQAKGKSEVNILGKMVLDNELVLPLA